MTNRAPPNEMKTRTYCLTTISIIILVLHLDSTLSYNITPVNSSSGLIYKHLGKTHLANSKYTLLTFFNLTHLDEQIHSSFLLYYKSLAVCSRLTANHVNYHCENQLKYIKTKIDSILNTYKIISHQLTSSRHKRGIINGIGTGLKWLFGTPDAGDAQFYTDSINSIIANQKQTEIIMQQVKIISATITNFNNSMQTLNKNTKILNENIKKFDDFMAQTSSFSNRISIENEVMQHVLVEMTDEIENTLDKYVDSIALISKGIINYNLISPKDLLLY